MKTNVHIIRKGIDTENIVCPNREESEKIQRLFLKKGTGKKKFIYWECHRCACQFGISSEIELREDEE